MLYCLYRDLMLCTSRFSFFDTYDRCFCVCVCACHPERNFVELNGSIPHFLWISKAPAQHIKQRYSIIERHIGSYMGAPVFPLCNLRHPRDLKSTTSRSGTLLEPCISLYLVPNIYILYIYIYRIYIPPWNTAVLVRMLGWSCVFLIGCHFFVFGSSSASSVIFFVSPPPPLQVSSSHCHHDRFHYRLETSHPWTRRWE